MCGHPDTPHESAERLLERHEIKPTSSRILVVKAMEAFPDTFSLSDLETELESVDKSTIFRVLTLFAQHSLIHEIDDGSGSTKYCLCHNTHPCDVDELHCHFYCESCHKTFCLSNIHVPPIHLPAGFKAGYATYVLKGTCPDCSRG